MDMIPEGIRGPQGATDAIPASSKNVGLSGYMTLIILVTGVVGGVLLIILVIVLCKHCTALKVRAQSKRSLQAVDVVEAKDIVVPSAANLTFPAHPLRRHLGMVSTQQEASAFNLDHNFIIAIDDIVNHTEALGIAAPEERPHQPAEEVLRACPRSLSDADSSPIADAKQVPLPNFCSEDRPVDCKDELSCRCPNAGSQHNSMKNIQSERRPAYTRTRISSAVKQQSSQSTGQSSMESADARSEVTVIEQYVQPQRKEKSFAADVAESISSMTRLNFSRPVRSPRSQSLKEETRQQPVLVAKNRKAMSQDDRSSPHRRRCLTSLVMCGDKQCHKHCVDSSELEEKDAGRFQKMVAGHDSSWSNARDIENADILHSCDDPRLQTFRTNVRSPTGAESEHTTDTPCSRAHPALELTACNSMCTRQYIKHTASAAFANDRHHTFEALEEPCVVVTNLPINDSDETYRQIWQLRASLERDDDKSEYRFNVCTTDLVRQPHCIDTDVANVCSNFIASASLVTSGIAGHRQDVGDGAASAANVHRGSSTYLNVPFVAADGQVSRRASFRTFLTATARTRLLETHSSTERSVDGSVDTTTPEGGTTSESSRRNTTSFESNATADNGDCNTGDALAKPGCTQPVCDKEIVPVDHAPTLHEATVSVLIQDTTGAKRINFFCDESPCHEILPTLVETVSPSLVIDAQLCNEPCIAEQTSQCNTTRDMSAWKRRRDYRRRRQISACSENVDSLSGMACDDGWDEPDDVVAGSAHLLARFSRTHSVNLAHKRQVVSRDYSIDEKTDSIFRKFLSHDPVHDSKVFATRSKRSRFAKKRQLTDPGSYGDHLSDHEFGQRNEINMASELRASSPLVKLVEEDFSELA